MDRSPLTSSNIKSCAFDDNVLEVEFQKGGVYRYHGVTPAEFEALKAAKSPGSYLRSVIIPAYKARAKVPGVPRANG